MGPIWGPPGQIGPMLTLWTLLSGQALVCMVNDKGNLCGENQSASRSCSNNRMWVTLTSMLLAKKIIKYATFYSSTLTVLWLVWSYYQFTMVQVTYLLMFFRDALLTPEQSWDWPGVGVTKPILSVPLFSTFSVIVKTNVSYWISRLYLAGVAAA